jgi:long-chain acyl-CoA synthetase
LPLSIRRTLAGKNIFVTGVSGFLGKVWLSIALEHLPDLGKVYVLLRGKGRSVLERFERLVRTSPAFRPLHEAHGSALGEFIADRVQVVEGDLSLPDLGIDPGVRERLQREVDLVLNFAGLVEFNPDLRESMASNVDGAVRVLDLVKGCEKAALVHVSTCFVAGDRNGFVEELPLGDEAPNGKHFDVEAEYREIHESIERIIADLEAPKSREELREQVIERIRERGYEESERRISSMVRLLGRKQIRNAMTDEGTRRARRLGWQNTYCYTKALAEALLEARGEGVRYTVLRPAIVESSVRNPFPGWNEGFNTCGPLTYLAGTWFRQLPAQVGNPLDVIPVDYVCNALMIAATALLRGEHAKVYQCGTSERNLVTIDRVSDLSALDHRRHLRRRGDTAIDRLLLSRWDIRASDPEHMLNVGNVRRMVRQLARFLRKGLPEKIPSEVRDKADSIARTSENAERKLRQIDELLDLFLPFIHDNYTVFECRAIGRHEVEEEEFRFTPEDIEWRSYWLDVEMPGLRRWCFPTIEGKDREEYEPEAPFELPQRVVATARTEPRKEAG